MKRVFITGANGCIGSATCRALLDLGVDELVCFSRSGTPPNLFGRCGDVLTIKGDLTNAEHVVLALADANPTHIIHLAAYQTPDCNAHPMQGMAVNVDGTAHVVRAATALPNLERMVIASSSAVYGKRERYPGPAVTTKDPLLPVNLYGYWKLANEGAAQAFHHETQVPAVAVRLSTTYGPGRDRGYTAAPTTAMKHAVAGTNYRIPYTGREHYHYVEDVGAGFAHACIEAFEGYATINLRGTTTDVADFCRLIQTQGSALGLSADIRVAEDAEPIPFVCDLDDTATLKVFPKMPLTPLSVGVRASLEHFLKANTAY
ncbi:MAG: NAD(P)-dependent oxidoreductase [Planctomycetota bacterium]